MEDINLMDIAEELLIVNKITIDKLFQLDNAADCIALYMLYYKTAKWQKTNQPKATDEYVRKCLKWGLAKIRKDGKISGWYVRVAYLVSKQKLENIKIKTITLDNSEVEQEVLNPTNRDEKINTLKENNKYFKRENNITINSNMEKPKTPFSRLENNIEEKPKKVLTDRQKKAIERNKILEEFIKDEDEDIKKALRDYVDIRRKRGLEPKQLQIILEDFEKVYTNKPKSIILEQIRKATARGWSALVFEDTFKGTPKVSYGTKPSFDNTINHNIPKGVASMTPEERKNYEENELARDENGNFIKF